MYKNNHLKEEYSESYIYKKLFENGIEVKWSSLINRKSKEDFITSDGKRIDVKFSTFSTIGKRKAWRFNCHHHGKKQTHIDYYICVLIDEKKHLIFVFPSELIEGYQINISDRQLHRGKFDYFKENWDLIKS